RLMFDPVPGRLGIDPCITHKSFKITFFKDSDLSDFVQQSITRYTGAFGININAVKPIFLLWLIEYWDSLDLVNFFIEHERNFVV
ncbi:hypothetical protein ACFL42_04490, partial [Candidatus Omnitrophota bacterium]